MALLIDAPAWNPELSCDRIIPLRGARLNSRAVSRIQEYEVL